MRASDIAEPFPLVRADTDAREAALLLAEQRLPGLVVADGNGCPLAILPASQVVCFLVPAYVLEDQLLAGVLCESMADRAASRLAGRTVWSLLPPDPPEPAIVDAADTVVEVAAVMAANRSPLAAVMDGRTMIGVITSSRLLSVALAG